MSSIAKLRYTIHPHVMMNLHACHKPHRLHFEILTLFVQFLADDDIKCIRETFQSMDVDNGGDIEIAELRKAYQFLNSQPGNTEISDEKIDEILAKVDQDKNNLIEYSEFLAHALTDK